MLLEWSGGKASSLHFSQIHQLGNRSLTGNHPKELIGDAVIKGLLLGVSTEAEGGKGGFY